jgi:hypothetical protein
MMSAMPIGAGWPDDPEFHINFIFASCGRRGTWPQRQPSSAQALMIESAGWLQSKLLGSYSGALESSRELAGDGKIGIAGIQRCGRLHERRGDIIKHDDVVFLAAE